MREYVADTSAAAATGGGGGSKAKTKSNNETAAVVKEAPVTGGTVAVFDEYLPHGSLLIVSAEGNRCLTHSVPPDPTWNMEGAPDAVRYSVIFRTIKSKRPVCVSPHFLRLFCFRLFHDIIIIIHRWSVHRG
jgi:hypothetical protein